MPFCQQYTMKKGGCSTNYRATVPPEKEKYTFPRPRLLKCRALAGGTITSHRKTGPGRLSAGTGFLLKFEVQKEWQGVPAGNAKDMPYSFSATFQACQTTVRRLPTLQASPITWTWRLLAKAGLGVYPTARITSSAGS